MSVLTWGTGQAPLSFDLAEDRPVVASLDAAVRHPEPDQNRHRAAQAMVEILTVAHGRGLTSERMSRTKIGDGLRYRDHSTGGTGQSRYIEITQEDDAAGVIAVTRITQCVEDSVYTATTTVRATQPLTLLAVTSLALDGITGRLGDAAELQLWSARNEWCAESRWSSEPLRGGSALSDINTVAHEQASRGSVARSVYSSWSAGGWLPMGALTGPDGAALAWQVENNGPWSWEVNDLFDPADAVGLSLTGPTDLRHSWARRLQPGESFTSVPATVAVANNGIDGVFAALTAYRRVDAARVASPGGHQLVFNDYMNALMGDPTTDRLRPLVDAAAAAGAETFCIDAGWYDDGGHWWPSVGEWLPSQRRFQPDGLTGMLGYIRDHGMRPGLWIEPEVIGVLSPAARSLPESAFMHRHGERIVEHDRHFLNLRDPHARAHLDGVFDRLIDEYGCRYFKWDYNVTPGSGPDDDADAPGDGLLQHARALLEWIDALRARHPDVMIESCSSGAQRVDQATLGRFDLQSTSDQQDPLHYPAIAAAAGTLMPLERAGNWAYPQREMTAEGIAFTLATGLSGRLYLSGMLDRLTPAQLQLVTEATAIYPSVIAHHAQGVPGWPLGLPGWNDDIVALTSVGAEETLLFVWSRTSVRTSVDLPLHRSVHEVEQIFPRGASGWSFEIDSEATALHVAIEVDEPSARVFRLL